MQVPSGVSIVGAEDGNPVAQADRGFARDLDQVRRALALLPRAALRVRPGDVEIAQRAVVERVSRRRIREHPLGHQLRRAVGVDRLLRIILGHRHFLWRAVNGGGRGKEDVLDSRLDRSAHQRVRRDRVVPIIIERLLDQFRDHDRPSEMHDRADALLGEDAFHQRRVGDVSFVERNALGHRLADTVGQIVDDRPRSSPRP